IPRQPVEGGAGRLERLVEVAEPHLEDDLAFAALAQAQPLLAGDQPAERRNRRRLAARPRKGRPGQRVRMLGDESAPEERAERMAEEDDRPPRLFGDDEAGQGPEVANDIVPAPLVGEMAEIGRDALGPVAAMIAGVDAVARRVERGGETSVAAAVLGEAMGDLHAPARTPSGEPATCEDALTIVGAKLEFAPRHSSPDLPSAPLRFGKALESRSYPLAASSRRATGKFSSPNRS